MERLQRWLDKGLKAIAPEDVLTAGKVFAAWEDIVGPAIAPRTRPRFLRDGILFVEVASAAWANELTLLKPRVLEALARKLGTGRVRDLRWQVAPRLVDAPPTHAARVEPAPALRREALDMEEEGAIAESAKELDDRLAGAVGRAFSAAARRLHAQEAAGYQACEGCGMPLSPALVRLGGPRCPLCRTSGAESNRG